MNGRTRVAIFALVALSMLACVLLSPTPPPIKPESATATAISAAGTLRVIFATQTKQAEKDRISTPTAAPTRQALPEDAGELSVTGPWLLYTTRNGLAVVNTDGRGHTDLNLPLLVNPQNALHAAAVSSTGWVALLTADDPATYRGLSLVLLHLPDGEVRPVSRLLSDDLEERASLAVETESDLPDSVRAVLLPGGVVFSADGRMMAFISAREGSSADLYLYDMESGAITRKTTGSYHAATPLFTPSGNWVIVQEIITFITPQTWQMRAVWAAGSNRAEVRKLYNVEPESQGEIFLAWLTGDELLTVSRVEGGYGQLRTVNVMNSVFFIVLKDVFQQYAYDPATQTVAFTLPGDAERPEGVYLARIGSFDRIRQVQSGVYDWLHWNPQAGMFAAGGLPGWFSFDTKGNPGVRLAERQVYPSPSKQWLAAWGNAENKPGVRLYYADGNLLQTVTQEPVNELMWRDDSRGFFYQTDNLLVYVSFPRANPVIIDDNLDPLTQSMAWIGKTP